MSIADGEYEIDLTQLLQEPAEPADDGSFAIRYGFIPDSMDQAKPLTLYQTDKECILKARANETGSNSLSIIFEGTPQRHRRSNNPALDSYYLAFPPPNSPGKVQLRRLNTTIRVSKSRNAKKWEEKCEKWYKQLETEPVNLHIPKIEVKKSAPAAKPEARKPISSKRPPVPVESIISESDFEDLDMEKGTDDFPLIVIEEEPEEKPLPPVKVQPPQPPKVAPAKPSKTAPKLTPLRQSKPRPKPPKASKAPPKPKPISKPIPVEDDDFDMADDFKDLEDQLEEVLGEDDQESSPESKASTPHTTANDTRTSVSSNANEYEDSDNDSDNSDHDSYKFSGGPIIINYDDDSSKLSNRAYESFSTERKPMSLRDLYGNDTTKPDDISSSEAE